MTTDKIKQTIKSGSESINIQSDRLNLNVGLTYSDAKDVALNVFKENFVKLSEEATQIAIKRAVQFTDDYLTKLLEREPEALNNLKEPSIQYALFNAQVDYAKSGDKEIEEILTDLLVDRTSEVVRGLRQIVLEESLKIVPKLTYNQLDTLTVGFLLKYTQMSELENKQDFEYQIRKQFSPFLNSLSTEASLYQHLEYCGCGSINIGSVQVLGTGFEAYFIDKYPSIFFRGFTHAELEERLGKEVDITDVLVPSIHNSSKLQMGSKINFDVEKYLEQSLLSPDNKQKVKSLYQQFTMSREESKRYLIGIDEKFNKLNDIWNNSYFRQLTLTSVGIAIAQANYRKKTNLTIDLGIWIK